MNIKTMLQDEIQDEFKSLEGMELGNENYKITVDGLTKLVDRAIEIEKMESENRDRIERQNVETDLKMIDLENQRKDRIVKNILQGIGVVGGLGVTIWGTIVSINFEKEGTFTTAAGRNFVNKVFKFIK